MPEDRKNARKEWHLVTVDNRELIAQVAHERLGHGQTDGSRHLAPPLRCDVRKPYEGRIAKSRNMQRLLQDEFKVPSATGPSQAFSLASRLARRREMIIDKLNLMQQSLHRIEFIWEEHMLRIAVLGCGRIGRMHAANIAAHPRAQLIAVYDVNQSAADTVAAQHEVRAFGSAEEVFASRDVDAVLVATVTDTHADYIERAVAAGKPVLCEKPIDLSLERVNRCADAVRSKGVPIQIGFNRRFDPGHRAAWKAARSGEIGELHQVIITSRDPGMPPRSYYQAAGGLFRDMTIHDFDLARFMLAEEPEEVFAVGGRLIDPSMMEELNDYDSAMIVMRTSSGKQCHINNSRTSTYGYDQRVELLGSAGMVISENRRADELRRYSAARSEAAAPYLDFFIERYREAFDAEIDAFVTSVEQGEAPQVGFEDGRRALILAEAAMKSAVEGRSVNVGEIK